MRHDVAELERFPREGALSLRWNDPASVPNSASVMEFKNETDVQIAEKMLRFPLLGEKMADKWNLALTQEFNMTNDSKLFRTSPGPGRLPLFEGKMFNQFTSQWGEPKYWLDNSEASGILSEQREGRQSSLPKIIR